MLSTLWILWLAPLLAHAQGLESQWTGWGGNIFNNRWADSDVNTGNVKTLTQHCHIQFPHGVSAPPALHGEIAYFPTWNGTFVAFDYITCRLKWQTNITAFLEQQGTLDPYQAAVVYRGSRTSPQIDGDTLFIGTQLHALLLALDLHSGAVIAHIQVNPHPLAVVTMSPTFFDGQLFVGASSDEESAAVDPTYPCCSFVGNFAAFSFNRATGTFSTLWNRTVLPEPYGVGEWTGWQSAIYRYNTQ